MHIPHGMGGIHLESMESIWNIHMEFTWNIPQVFHGFHLDSPLENILILETIV
jgi:hypothetical protein